MSGSLFSMVIMLFPLVSRMLIYIFLLFSIIIVFCDFFGIICHISGTFFLLGWLQPPGIFTALTKPILFLCHCKGFNIVIYLVDILVLFFSRWASKRVHLILCPFLVYLGLHINFSKSDLCLIQTFCFLGLCWDALHKSISSSPDKLAGIQQLALSLLETQPVTVHWFMSFLCKANFCANGHSQLWRMCHVIQIDMLTVYHSPTHLFSSVLLSF